MKCPDCGGDVAEHSRFCSRCGRRIGPPLAPPTAISADLPTERVDTLATEPVLLTDSPTVALTDDTAVWVDTAPGPTPTAEYPVAPVTAPIIFDGSDDLADYPEERAPFRLRTMFVISLFAAATALLTIVADVIDIRTTRPTAGIATGVRSLDDLGSNLGLVAFSGAAVMVLGGLLACFGLRWGAGLAGGAGLALLGWAGLTIGLAELPIALAESITRTSSETFTLRVTRDVGWWLIAVLGVMGLLVFALSIRMAGSGGRRGTQPVDRGRHRRGDRRRRVRSARAGGRCHVRRQLPFDRSQPGPPGGIPRRTTRPGRPDRTGRRRRHADRAELGPRFRCGRSECRRADVGDVVDPTRRPADRDRRPQPRRDHDRAPRGDHRGDGRGAGAAHRGRSASPRIDSTVDRRPDRVDPVRSPRPVDGELLQEPQTGLGRLVPPERDDVAHRTVTVERDGSQRLRLGLDAVPL